MKVLILGGDGFIGSYLCRKHLDANDHVVVIDINEIRVSRLPLTYEKVDLSLNTRQKVKGILKKHKPDFVYNCIAIANPGFYVKYPVETFDLDFTVNYNIILELIHEKVPVMHFSTSEVYGKKWYTPYTEDTTDFIIGPSHKSRWIYATSKILLEQLIFSHKSDCCIIRPQNFCGWDLDWLPDMQSNSDKHWIPRLPACIINNLFSNKQLNIVLPGTQKRCYTDINEAIECLYLITTNWSNCTGQVINVGNPKNEIDIKSFILQCLEEWNNYVPENYRHTQGFKFTEGVELYGEGYEDCERRLFSCDKVTGITGWQPTTDIDTIITKLIRNSFINYQRFFIK